MRSLKILVAEDAAEFRGFVCSLLRSTGEFQIEAVSDGREAVQKAQELQPDLILLDLGLPILDGMEVARRVRRLTPCARILFFSALSDPDVVSEALRLGAGYVHKPSVQGDLLPAIEAILRGEQFVSRDVAPGEGSDVRPNDDDP